MSMNFVKPLTDKQQSFLREFLGDKLVDMDERTVLFDSTVINQPMMKVVANRTNQVVSVELNELDEIKTLSDGTQYRVTRKGWVKVT